MKFVINSRDDSKVIGVIIETSFTIHIFLRPRGHLILR